MTMFLMMNNTAGLSILKNNTSHLFSKTRNVMSAHICSHKRKHNCIVTQTRQLSQKIRIFPTNLLYSGWCGSCGQQVVDNVNLLTPSHSLQSLAKVLEITNSKYLLKQIIIRKHHYLSQLRQHRGKLSHFPQLKKSLGCCGDTAFQVQPDLGSAKSCTVSLTNKKRCQNISGLSGITFSLLHLSSL